MSKNEFRDFVMVVIVAMRHSPPPILRDFYDGLCAVHGQVVMNAREELSAMEIVCGEKMSRLDHCAFLAQQMLNLERVYHELLTNKRDKQSDEYVMAELRGIADKISTLVAIIDVDFDD